MTCSTTSPLPPLTIPVPIVLAAARECPHVVTALRYWPLDPDDLAEAVGALVRAGVAPAEVAAALELTTALYDSADVVVLEASGRDGYDSWDVDVQDREIGGGELYAIAADEAEDQADTDAEGQSYTVDVTVEVVYVDGQGVCHTESAEASETRHPKPPRCYPVGDPDDGERADWRVIKEDGHAWAEPVDWVGGICENPGVWSLGGTRMRYVSICRDCGIMRYMVDAGSQRNPGEPDVTVEYEAATERFASHYESSDD